MSGFTRGRKYGDKLVYEALHGKWDRYHAHHCGCGEDWVKAHAIPAGFTVLHEGASWTVLTGPGLTEGVDETALTTNALWEAVTGEPGNQTWIEPVMVDNGPPPRPKPPPDPVRDARNAARRKQAAARREALRAQAPATDAQQRYLTNLTSGLDLDAFDATLRAAVEGTAIAARGRGEPMTSALRRLTKPAASRMIELLREQALAQARLQPGCTCTCAGTDAAAVCQVCGAAGACQTCGACLVCAGRAPAG